MSTYWLITNAFAALLLPPTVFILLGQVIISRADEVPHEDPAIGAFIALLEADIRSGQHLCSLPNELVQAMLATLKKPVDFST